jgi:hypothetical protein
MFHAIVSCFMTVAKMVWIKTWAWMLVNVCDVAWHRTISNTKSPVILVYSITPGVCFSVDCLLLLLCKYCLWTGVRQTTRGGCKNSMSMQHGISLWHTRTRQHGIGLGHTRTCMRRAWAKISLTGIEWPTSAENRVTWTQKIIVIKMTTGLPIV